MLRKKSLTLYIILLAVILCFGAGYVFFYYPLQTQLAAVTYSSLSSAPSKYVNGLDGRLVNTKAETTPQVAAVMIDNHPDAYPLSGLSKASVVYEAPVEGQFTRFMAIYNSRQNASPVGPIRSARSYFLDWLSEYGKGLYMHSGGSPEALRLIKKLNVLDANEFYWGDYYWRNLERQAPHDIYTNSYNWQRIIAPSAVASAIKAGNGWKFARTVGRHSASKKEIKISYAPVYEVGWKYEPDTFSFVRFVNSAKQQDSDGADIKARNVLVQYVSAKVLDDEGRLEISTIGTGSARILKKGEVIQGYWVKKSRTERTRFYTKQGAEVVLLPGTTWVEIVPNNTKVEVIN